MNGKTKNQYFYMKKVSTVNQRDVGGVATIERIQAPADSTLHMTTICLPISHFL